MKNPFYVSMGVVLCIGSLSAEAAVSIACWITAMYSANLRGV